MVQLLIKLINISWAIGCILRAMASMNITKSANIWITQVEKLKQFNLVDNVPNIQFPSLAMEVESGSTITKYHDAKAYSSKCGPELELISQLNTLSIRGAKYVSMLYSFRSVSKAIPMLVSCLCW